jgi:hypothetical protein
MPQRDLGRTQDVGVAVGPRPGRFRDEATGTKVAEPVSQLFGAGSVEVELAVNRQPSAHVA